MKRENVASSRLDMAGRDSTQITSQSWTGEDKHESMASHHRRPCDEGDKRRIIAVLLLLAISAVCVVSETAGEQLPIPNEPAWNILGHLLIVSLATSQINRVRAGNKLLAIGLLFCFLSGTAGTLLNLYSVAAQLSHSLYFALQDVVAALASCSAVAVGLSAAGAERLQGRVRTAVYIMAWLVISCIALTLLHMYTSVILLDSFLGICLDSTPVAVGGCLLLFACLAVSQLLGATR